MVIVYLYKCEKCNTVIAIYEDRGRKFYIDRCEACKDWADFERIVITKSGMFGVEASPSDG